LIIQINNGITIFADSSLYFLSIRLDLIISFALSGVEITGKISRAGDIIKEIEIEKLKKITYR
jgi:hypothetical protein